MPLAPNPLLQATAVAKPQPAAATNAAKSAESGKDNTSSFAQVFSKQSQPKAEAKNEPRSKPVHDKPVATKDKSPADDKSAAPKPEVADSGKSLPADKVSKKDANKKDDDTVATAAPTDDKTTDPLATDAAPVDPTQDPALDPTLDPAVMQALVAQQVNQPVQPVVTTATPATESQVEVPAATAALTAQPTTPASDTSFDPSADDPLAGLPAVQLALEQNAKAQASATPALSTAKTSSAQTDADPLQIVVNNLALPVDQQPTNDASTESGDKAFKGLIEDGLKDIKSAASDTRVDDFANRLAALSQAMQPKTAATAAPPLLAQPLAMHQSGWSEAVVDRVMYLSSQNLKSADIQLEPAELGRLDIRVSMAADQQTQITFMSAHAGVREALEGQMSKLRDSFNQQGLGQVDVNVSDQSRGNWQGQGQNQQEQANQSQRAGGVAGIGSGRGDGVDDGTIQDVAQVIQPQRIIGSSEVDYYA